MIYITFAPFLMLVVNGHVAETTSIKSPIILSEITNSSTATYQDPNITNGFVCNGVDPVAYSTSLSDPLLLTILQPPLGPSWESNPPSLQKSRTSQTSNPSPAIHEMRQNSHTDKKLRVGVNLNVPLRCACPTPKYLLTYIIYLVGSGITLALPNQKFLLQFNHC